ncbi:calcium-binding protein [Pelagibius litoralis]|uniref:Calcium-binding protein n=1 Tax=Pelagibius litoralis TaxID=374515 RepID=A0A967KDN1_9PROT|nr:calcium-binding protein [Pelagibius litoralis]NIA72357.1 calcium-binding protein [Pelagibius litoralis]
MDLVFLVNALDIPPVFNLPNTPANAALILNVLDIPLAVDQANLVTTLGALEKGLDGAGLNLGLWDTPISTLGFVAANAGFFGIDTEFGGNDRIFGRGGNDTIIDLEGHNRITIGDGDDTIYLGHGNDRITDTGGNNTITDLGGNNTITLLATTSFAAPFVGIDIVNTGDGNDNINAFDGRNIINAGDGNNTVRGGDNYDEFVVGTGDDFVEVRGGFADEDANGNGILDFGEDSNFNGVLDGADSEVFALLNVGQGFEAHNYVVDLGGNDNIRSTASASDQGDDLVLSDVIVTLDDPDVNPGFRSIALGAGEFGDDLIDLGAGDNFIIGGGGADTIRTLQGDDIVFTSFFSPGNDEIDTGAGADFINPGGGSDTVTGGAGADTVDLENDGAVDVLVYTDLLVDVSFTAGTTDIVTGFEESGVDKLDVSGLGVDLGMLQFFAVGPGLGDPAQQDFLVAWDTDGNAAPNFFTTILVDVNQGLLTPGNFIFDDAALIA